ncbi:2-oxoacid:ferredoxin oxidoreductase subunit beta [Desulfonatronovibrio hydrogenovorans]|uniref:2-oxoacid:ferredoxin oxidoreductase subunit beta n=1 Tax=Desulfonatronovibrio hydrogenovorans TaxID=53245 RepID=UPI00048D114A|nr:2-oxoacid:ferredoxin oxidoreductase subunit beta [Desulfonatronovibrio hydrogenovorans]
MVSVDDYGDFETAWCPGCGNHSILKAVKKALASMGLEPHESIFVSGIGQAAKSPHYLKANVFNGLHGRALPAATGIKLANPRANVIVQSGDGCNYGEGGNHFLAAIRRNIGLTLLAHDNQIYGLTKGQASPTTTQGHATKAQPGGNPSAPFNPVAVAVTMQANFVARGFSGMIDHLADLIVQAINHPGFSLIDIMQPCVTFNKVNTFAWYKERCYEPQGHDPEDWEQAIRLANQWGDRIPVGVIYRGTRPAFEQTLPHPTNDLLYKNRPARDVLKEIMNVYS